MLKNREGKKKINYGPSTSRIPGCIDISDDEDFYTNYEEEIEDSAMAEIGDDYIPIVVNQRRAYAIN